MKTGGRFISRQSGWHTPLGSVEKPSRKKKRVYFFIYVIPAEAGIQLCIIGLLDSRFRGSDKNTVA